MTINHNQLMPFKFRQLDNEYLITSLTGDFEFLTLEQLKQLVYSPSELEENLELKLKSKFFLLSNNAVGSKRTLASRLHQKKSTILLGTALHIIVPTLQCEHSCSYCQVSRSLEGEHHTISHEDLIKACYTVFESTAENITVEFQGGDPLIKFDLVKLAVEKINELNQQYHKHIRFVVTSTLHQLDDNMCQFFKDNQVYLSTSIDGELALHNQNRPIKGRNAYERTINGLKLARLYLGNDAISALMTTTKNSLAYPEEIIDQYVELGFHEIFIRSLSDYGFAKKNAQRLSYSNDEFIDFYQKALNRVIHWNQQGYPLIEVNASILLNKILSPFDSGYVDLQSPTGAGLGAIVYNYDGFVYPSDESRMIAETGDTSLRLGKIGDSLSKLLNSSVQKSLIESSLNFINPTCCECAYQPYCGLDPVSSYNEFGILNPPVYMTHHCEKYKSLFDIIFKKLKQDEYFGKLALTWALCKG